MAQEHIMFDKTEIVMVIVSNNTHTVNLTYDKIMSVTIEPIKERKLGIVPFDSEKIIVRSRKQPEPYVFFKSKEKAYFDSYKENFAKFCKANGVTFYDNTQADKG